MFDQLDTRSLKAVRVSAKAVAQIERSIANIETGIETGGILLGRSSESLVDVTIAGGPGPNAVHRSDFFLRDLAHSQELADRAWTSHRAVWLGEWHTHPNTGLEPSTADLATYRQHLSDHSLAFDDLISIVARGRSRRLQLVAWSVTRCAVTRVPLLLPSAAYRS